MEKKDKDTNVNLFPLKSITSWDSQRIFAYKSNVENYAKKIKTEYSADNQDVILKKCENYIKELEKILKKRNI